MIRSKFVALISLVLLSSMFATTGIIKPAHGPLVGIVCVAPDLSNMCPADPQVLTPASPGATQLRVAVVISSSNAFSGFDIILKADHTILTPADAVSGTVLGANPTIIVKCIGGNRISGSQCSSQAISADTIEVALAGSLTAPPTTGLLFTAVYNIVVQTSNTPIGFQTGCSNTSVSNVCVTISTGAPPADPETVLAGQFSNKPYFAIDASPVSMIVEQTTGNSSLVTLTSLNNFAGTVALSTSTSVTGLSAAVAPASLILLAGGTNFTGLTVSVLPSVPKGNYTVTLTATSGSLSNSLVFPILVLTPDFIISSKTASLVANASSAGPVTGKFNVTLTSIIGFAGNVSVTASPSPNLSASLSRPIVRLRANTLNFTILTVKANSTGTVTVTAVNGTLSHSSTVTFYLRDFTVGLNHAVYTIPQNSTNCPQCTATVTIANPTQNVGADFVDTVNLTTTVSIISGGTSTSSSGGLTVQCASSTIILPVLITTNSTTCKLTGRTPGDYGLVVTGKSGSYPLHSATAIFHVLGPDFAILPNATIQTITIGSNATFSLTIQDLLGLKGPGTFTSVVSPTGPPSFLSPTTVTLSGSANATIVLSIVTNSTTKPGAYIVGISGTVTQSSGNSITHMVAVLVVATAVPHPPQIVVTSLTATPLSASVGTKITYSITVLNNGTSTQNLTVDALVGDVVVNSTTITLAAGQSQTVSLTWNTRSYAAGSYILGGKVIAVPGQVDTGYNLARVSTPLTLSAPSNNGVLSTQDTLTIGLVVGVIGAIAFAVLYLRGRRTRMATS